MNAEQSFEYLIAEFEQRDDIAAGSMFGKRCIKVAGKAAIALFKETVVFKLPEPQHAEAMNKEGSELWDPSGKGRAMKEWVSVGSEHSDCYLEFAESALSYCRV